MNQQILTTDMIQVWSKSGIMMCLIPKEQAIEMLNDNQDHLKIVCGQAIAWY